MEVVLVVLAMIAGALGSVLGLGGGIILVPVLSLAFHIPIEQAIATSLLSIVATSNGAAIEFLKQGITNVRVASFLEVGTVAGAVSGVFLGSLLKPELLFLLFGLFLIFSAVQMFQRRVEQVADLAHPWALALNLNGVYKDEQGQQKSYKVQQVPQALAVMWVAGVLSAVLGIGAGVFKVMAMDRAMKLPIKVSSATSNLMIGVTAAASSLINFWSGRIDVQIATPICLGVFAGSMLGAKLMLKLRAKTIRKAFVVVMVLIGVQMIEKGLSGLF